MDQITYNSITLNSLINTVAWSIHFKIVFKILGFLDVENKLKLNNDRTKAIHFSASPSVNTTLQLPHTIPLGNTETESSGIVHNLSFIFNTNLSMKQYIIKTYKAEHIKIRCISSIGQYLTEDGTKTLVSSCILSRLDYCNFLLAG